MNNDNETPRNEWAFLGKGILRTFASDAKATVIGAVIGAVLGFLAAYILGFSIRTGIGFGALVGAFLGLAVRPLTSTLFDYDPPSSDKDREP